MRRIPLVMGPVAAVLLAAGLWAFEPWRLFTSSTIDEPAPSSSAAVSPQPVDATGPPSPAADAVLSVGRFVDGEHGTSGTARVVRLADGRRFLRLEGLSTSDGPDLHVWLSAARSGGGWSSYDDGAHLALGHLKATHGNQNYPIPAEADLSPMRSVVIWCDRFNVAFGSAPVRLG